MGGVNPHANEGVAHSPFSWVSTKSHGLQAPLRASSLTCKPFSPILGVAALLYGERSLAMFDW